MTQNVPPGVDFSNDPLLQGRNFSYLDTQLKRLGSPNFTHIPINAPKCPFHHFQQDGHMAMRNPVGRGNYQPNSFGQGARESPERGFRSFGEVEEGPKARLRPESFADHYSQARQFWISQTEVEQQHIVSAFTFELSKVDRPDIRARLVAGLRNVHEDLAAQVGIGLGLDPLPDPLTPAVEPLTRLDASPALSIVANGPHTFAGRKLGILVGAGADADIVTALVAGAQAQDGVVELIAPTIAGVAASSGDVIAADQRLDGAPSVLYDAVVIVTGPEGAAELAEAPAARDFAADAFAHCKFVGYTEDAAALFTAAGLDDRLDEGFVGLGATKDVAEFFETCAELRYWPRQAGLR
jgi:catalase